MVADITVGTAYDRHGRPFRRRKYLPGIAVGLAMFVITAIVWLIALSRPVDIRQAAACNPPPAPADGPAPDLGEQVSHPEMTKVEPDRLTDANIRVLNASGRGGQAADIAGSLVDLGFAQPSAENDPIYTEARLSCQGQIRFGAAGRAAAAAVWLVAPCVELYRDDRTDDTIDLALGTDFTTLAHNDDIEAVLASLRPEATVGPDMTLVDKIHASAC